MTSTNLIDIKYQQTGKPTNTNELGMVICKAKVYVARSEQYLLIKVPSASGKSCALMFVALDKLANQGIKKVVVAVSEKPSGARLETVWLNRQQMADLFGRAVKTIGKHVNNALKEELAGISVVAKFATTAADGKTYNTDHYSLDMIISVGYRVKSNRGIQFRIWANKILKEYLVKGYVVNEKIKLQQYSDLKQTVKLLSNVIHAKELSADEATGLLQVISDFTYALDTLDRYDYQELIVEHTTPKETIPYFFKGYIKACKI